IKKVCLVPNFQTNQLCTSFYFCQMAFFFKHTVGMQGGPTSPVKQSLFQTGGQSIIDFLHTALDKDSSLFLSTDFNGALYVDDQFLFSHIVQQDVYRNLQEIG